MKKYIGTHKTVIDRHIDNLTEGVSISLATLQRLEKNITDLGDDYISTKDAMILLTKENLLFLEKIFKMFATLDLESQWQSESLKDYQDNQKDSLHEKYLYIEEELYIDIRQKLEIITNNLIKTRTMLEGQPWI